MAIWNRKADAPASAPAPSAVRATVRLSPAVAKSLFSRVMTRGYEFISRRPEFTSYLIKDAGSDTLFRDLERIRWHARQEFRSNPIARAAVNKMCDHVVDAGLMLQPHCTDPKLRDQIKALWLDWCKTCDASGRGDFGGMQYRAFREMLNGGDAFYMHRYCLPSEQTVPYRVKILAADYVPVQAPTLLAKGGIETNVDGRPVAYWMWDRHPDDVREVPPQLIRVDARHVGHLFNPSEESYLRGDPFITPVLINISGMGRYNWAELARKESSSKFLAFITKKDGGEDRSFLGEDEEHPDPSGQSYGMIEENTVQVLDNGEDIKFHQGVDVGGQYDAYLTWQMRFISTGLGITFEDLTSDMEHVNDRTIRASKESFHKNIRQLQRRVLAYQFCQPIYERFLLAAIAAGKLDVPAGTDYSDLFSARWVSNGSMGVNPVQEMAAYKAAVRDGFMSRSEVVNKLGYDVEQVDSEQVADLKRADKLGLAHDTDGRRNEKGATDGAPWNVKDAPLAQPVPANADLPPPIPKPNSGR
jgi:lambda family phage portal protein